MLKGLRKNNQYSLYIPQVVDELVGGINILNQQYDWLNLTIPQQRPKQSTVFRRKDLSSNPQLVVGSSCLAGSPPCLAAVASTAPWAHHRPALPRSPRPSKAPAPGWQRNHPPRCDKAEISGLGQKVGWFTTVVPLGKHLNQAESHGFLIAKTQLKYS